MCCSRFPLFRLRRCPATPWPLNIQTKSWLNSTEVYFKSSLASLLLSYPETITGLDSPACTDSRWTWGTRWPEKRGMSSPRRRPHNTDWCTLWKRDLHRWFFINAHGWWYIYGCVTPVFVWRCGCFRPKYLKTEKAKSSFLYTEYTQAKQLCFM